MPLHQSKNAPRQGRRSFLALAAAVPALAQTQSRDWTNLETTRYPDPDVVALDKSFAKYKLFNAVIYRHYVGTRWAEGPAWCAQGQYLLWSDIPNNRQLRMTEEDGHVGVFRNPSGYSNGNTFDFEGRQLSCEHAGRRVVRYEHDGSVTVIADKFNGKPLNSPNDLVVQPNGICFSPDYKKLYIVDTGAPSNIQVFDVAANKLSGGRVFTDMKLNDRRGGSDGIRADVDGNIWAAANGGAGYDGVHIFTPEGQRIVMILLPEICANLCFGGPKRNRLYMAASQSLYSVFVGTRGAHVS